MIENLFKKTVLATDHRKSLLRHFQDNHIDWMHSCGGKGLPAGAVPCALAGRPVYNL